MDVKCEKCGTEYSLDETLVSPSGTSVRCTNCDNVFKAFPPSAGNGSNQTWILRQVGGATFPFDRMGALQEWITTGKVSPDDQISKGGGEWKRLGDIAEMKTFFDLAQTARASQPNSVPVAAGFPGAQEKSAHQATIRTQPVTHTEKPKGISATPKQGAPFAKVVSQVDTVPPPPMQPPQVGPSGANYTPAPGPALGNMTSAAWAATQIQTQPAQPQVQSRAPVGTPAAYVAQGPTVPQMDAQSLSEMHTMRAPSSHFVGVSGQPAPPTPAAPPVAPQPIAYQDTMAGVPQPTQPLDQQKTAVMDRAADEPPLSQVPASQSDQGWVSGTGVQVESGPAWAEKDPSLPTAVEDEFAQSRPQSNRKVGKWIALFVVLGIVGTAFYFFMFQREMVQKILGDVVDTPEVDRHTTFFVKGQESFLLDTESAFVQADREYHQVLALKENHAPTLAALAQMYAVWAQYLRDSEIDLRTDIIANTAEGVEPDFHEADRLDQESKKKISEATRWVNQALASDPELAEAHLAKADLDRLAGNISGAEAGVKKGRNTENEASADYISALIDIEKGAPNNEIQEKLGNVISSKPMLRALYRQARVQATAGENDAAKRSLGRVLELNSEHTRAKELIARIDSASTVALLKSGMKDDLPEGEDTAPETAEPLVEVPKHAAGGSFTAGSPAGGGGHVGGSTDSMLMRAKKLQENNNSGEAMKIYQKVLEKSPSNIDALSGLAYCYMDRGSGGQAIAHFRRALNVNGAFGPALIGTALTYKSQGQKAQALKWFKKYLEVHPSSKHSSLAKTNIKQLEESMSGEVITISDEPATENTGGGKPPASGSNEVAPESSAPPSEPAPAPSEPTAPSAPAPSEQPSETE